MNKDFEKWLFANNSEYAQKARIAKKQLGIKELRTKQLYKLMYEFYKNVVLFYGIETTTNIVECTRDTTKQNLINHLMQAYDWNYEDASNTLAFTCQYGSVRYF